MKLAMLLPQAGLGDEPTDWIHDDPALRVRSKQVIELQPETGPDMNYTDIDQKQFWS
jgi:hypothetical protein